MPKLLDQYTDLQSPAARKIKESLQEWRKISDEYFSSVETFKAQSAKNLLCSESRSCNRDLYLSTHFGMDKDLVREFFQATDKELLNLYDNPATITQKALERTRDRYDAFFNTLETAAGCKIEKLEKNFSQTEYYNTKRTALEMSGLFSPSSSTDDLAEPETKKGCTR